MTKPTIASAMQDFRELTRDNEWLDETLEDPATAALPPASLQALHDLRDLLRSMEMFLEDMQKKYPHSKMFDD